MDTISYIKRNLVVTVSNTKDNKKEFQHLIQRGFKLFYN